MNESEFYVFDASKDDCCSKCKHYGGIDSGYGFCNLNPPKEVEYKRLFGRSKYRIEYPTVAWCTVACSYFRDKRYIK